MSSDRHAVVDQFGGPFDEGAFSKWAEQLRRQLTAGAPNLGLIFIPPHFFERAEDILELARLHAHVPILAGCSTQAIVVNGREQEDGQALVLGLYHLPGARMEASLFSEQDVLDAQHNPGLWAELTGVDPEDVNGWLIFADPFHMQNDSWLESWNGAYPGKPVMGGLANNAFSDFRSFVYLNGKIADKGGVAVAIGGDVELIPLISQGCTPVGETWTVTRSEGHFIHQIGNRPAYQVLQETFRNLPVSLRMRAQGNLFLGLVMDEYREEFQRGDFLIRNLLAADPDSGTLAVGAFPRVGQTVQFQLRDAKAATDDLEAILKRAEGELANRKIYGGVLCTCGGRGLNMFAEESHDAEMIQQAIGPFGMSGFFCNGEFGPVGGHNFIHGYTAALTLFVPARKPADESPSNATGQG